MSEELGSCYEDGRADTAPSTGSSTATPALSVEDRAHRSIMGALRQHLQLHGACVSDHLHHAVTHIVMRPGHLSRADIIRVSLLQ